MRKPQDINDLTKCLKEDRGIVMVFCVECDDWKRVATLAVSAVMIKQNRAIVLKDIKTVMFICEDCMADIGYLLPEITRNKLEKSLVK